MEDLFYSEQSIEEEITSLEKACCYLHQQILTNDDQYADRYAEKLKDVENRLDKLYRILDKAADNALENDQ